MNPLCDTCAHMAKGVYSDECEECLLEDSRYKPAEAPAPTQVQEWEERFHAQIASLVPLSDFSVGRIKNFISREIAAAKEEGEQRGAERVVAKIESLCDKCCDSCEDGCYVSKFLKEVKKEAK